MEKETIKQMFDRMMADPDLKNNPMFKESLKFGDAMDKLTSDIIRPCLSYAKEHNDEDEGWAYTILISMARATCKLLYAFQHTATENDKDVFKFYYEELLPMCKEIAYAESDEMVKRAEWEDEKMKMKREVILAIADPNMTVDAIIDKFFKKDLTDELRKMLADRIEKMRREQADKLAKVRDMNKKED